MNILKPSKEQPEKPLWKRVLDDKRRQYEHDGNLMKAAEISRDIILIEKALKEYV